jgi:hypothetical protein
MLKNNGHEVMFDIEIPTPRGVIYAMYLQCGHEVVGAASHKMRTTIKQAHDKFGHCNEDAMRKIAKQLGWELIPGSLGACKLCAAGKVKQKKVPKLSEGEPAKAGENRIYLDIVTVKHKKGHPKPMKSNWKIMVDE